MSINAETTEGLAPAFDLAAFISRFVKLYAEGNESVSRCPFCDASEGHQLKIFAEGWRTYCCNAHDLNEADHIGFYACWTNTTRAEAAAALGNGAGLPDAKPVAQVPLKRLPFWGWRHLDRAALKGKTVWIHDLSGAVLVWRELVPERVHLGLIYKARWDDLSIVAKRKVVLVPENNAASRAKMQLLAAALYRAGHEKVMRLDLGLDPEFGTRELPKPGDDVIEWARVRSKAYPKPGEPDPGLEARIAEARARGEEWAQPLGSAQDTPEPPPVPQPSTAPPLTPAERVKGHEAEAASKAAIAPPSLTWDGLNIILGPKGEIKPCEHNAKELMAAAQQYDCLHFDKFLYRTRLGERDWSDADDRDAVCWLQSAYRVAGFTLNQTRTAAMALAHARQHDSLFEFVMGLPEWDGTPRIETAFIDAWGAVDTELTRAASRNFFIALHARAVEPGAQVDTLWAIEGPQGKLKSASLRTLGEHFHAEISAKVGSADFLRELRGIWIAELSELDSLHGREPSTVKRLLSAPSDRFVEKYEKHATAYPRRAVSVATTNEAEYWQDSTGGRRLIPIRIGEIRLDLIAANRLLWFAEARHQYQAGAHWWEFPIGIEGEQEQRQTVDPWEDTLRDAIQNGQLDQDGYARHWPTGWIASSVIMRDWLKLAASQQGRYASTRLGHVMRRLGFRPKKSGDGNERGWVASDTD